MDLQGKRALVTGGSRGIGRAIVMELAAAGADVAFSYGKSVGQAEEVCEAAGAGGRRILAFQSDVTSFEAARQLAVDTKEALGGIDILVNNAGITRDKLILQMTEQDWDGVIDTNLKGVFNVTRHVVPIMLKQRHGRILNIGSISGVIGLPGQTNYSASKAGLAGLTKALAKEVGRRNITCNTLAVGFVETEMTAALGEEYLGKMVEQIPIHRPAKPAEIARIVAIFCTDATEYINGQVIAVDGGLTM
jgi:3-oxoacyl-[acyl-carrier protein] reductase